MKIIEKSSGISIDVLIQLIEKKILKRYHGSGFYLIGRRRLKVTKFINWFCQIIAFWD